MTFETARAAIALAMRHTRLPGTSLGIIFFGGEPLLQKSLIRKIVRHCRELENSTGQRFHFKVTTNGSLLDEEFLTAPDTREIFIAMSHDGVEPAHNAHRTTSGGGHTFHSLEEAVSLLLHHKPYAPVMAVVNPDTVIHYADSVRFLFEKGFRYLIFSLNYGAEWNARSLRELRRQYEAIAGWYEQETLRESKFYFSPFEVKIGSHIRPGSCARERCELGQKQLSVGPDGRIFPCVQFVGGDEFCIGDIVAGIDEQKRARLHRVAGRDAAVCAGCAIRDRCNHYCGCLNRQATGAIDRVSPLLCAHERIVIPIADQLSERLFKKRSAIFVQKHYNDYYPIVSLAEDRSTGTAGPPTR